MLDRTVTRKQFAAYRKISRAVSDLNDNPVFGSHWAEWDDDLYARQQRALMISQRQLAGRLLVRINGRDCDGSDFVRYEEIGATRVAYEKLIRDTEEWSDGVNNYSICYWMDSDIPPSWASRAYELGLISAGIAV